ncbi:MAG TPA: glycosyltransferase family 2 protein [Patescibacteria group bacterium]|nr:glycosyltransferase family 2 protein [Patescibacteria group bacterium]
MQLSIIITNYKNPELLKVCIDSIKKNITLSDYEIIVADSATEENTELMMREKYPDIRYIPSKENIGFGLTVENGYKASQGKNILILNGDIIVKKDSIEKLLQYINKNEKIGIVAPMLLSFNDSMQYSCCRFYTPLTIVYRRTPLGKTPWGKKHVEQFLMKDYDHKETREVDWVQGSAILTTRAAIERVGLMDRRFQMYFEDVDWCRRFWEAGLKVVYYPQAKMYHYHGRGSAGKNLIKTLLFNRLTWLHIISAFKYFAKYRRRPLPKHN